MVKENTFRSDLYFRLHVLTLNLPPLRDRGNDIHILLHNMFMEYGELGKKASDILQSNIDILDQYGWHGNIRELKAFAEYFKVLTEIYGENSSTSIQVFIQQSIKSFFLNYGNEKKQLYEGNEADDLDTDNISLLNNIYNMNLNGKIASRYALAKIPEIKALGLTEARIRNRIVHLAERGYVSIGKTKQGILLTQYGEDVIKKLK